MADRILMLEYEYACPHCDFIVTEEALKSALKLGVFPLKCPKCGGKVPVSADDRSRLVRLLRKEEDAKER
jgi:hypothetical protein